MSYIPSYKSSVSGAEFFCNLSQINNSNSITATTSHSRSNSADSDSNSSSSISIIQSNDQPSFVPSQNLVQNQILNSQNYDNLSRGPLRKTSNRSSGLFSSSRTYSNTSSSNSRPFAIDQQTPTIETLNQLSNIQPGVPSRTLSNTSTFSNSSSFLHAPQRTNSNSSDLNSNGGLRFMRRRKIGSAWSEYGSELSLLLEAVENNALLPLNSVDSSLDSNSNDKNVDDEEEQAEMPEIESRLELSSSDNGMDVLIQAAMMMDQDEERRFEEEEFEALLEAQTRGKKSKRQEVVNEVESEDEDYGSSRKKSTTTKRRGSGRKSKDEMRKPTAEFKNKIFSLLENTEIYGQLFFWDSTGTSIIIGQGLPNFISVVLEANFRHGNPASLNRQFTSYQFRRLPHTMADRLLKTMKIDERDWKDYTVWQNDHFKKSSTKQERDSIQKRITVTGERIKKRSSKEFKDFEFQYEFNDEFVEIEEENVSEFEVVRKKKSKSRKHDSAELQSSPAKGSLKVKLSPGRKLTSRNSKNS